MKCSYSFRFNTDNIRLSFCAYLSFESVFMVPFHPSFILKNKHLQTVYATLFRKPLLLDTQREVFELEDGDFVDCHWLEKPEANNTKPIVILFHGLAGCYRSPYIEGAMQALRKGGYIPVIMNFRGCSGRDNKRAKTYHSGATSDAKAWIEHLKVSFPDSPLFAIGYSLGGNMLLKLLGEYGHAGSTSPLTAAISISAPMQLDDSAEAIQTSFFGIYERHLLRLLKRTLIKKYQQHDMESLLGKTPKEIQTLKTIREFDDVYTAKVNGFDGVQGYYNKSSAKQYLPHIKTNTLVIHALDDPFMTPKILPQACLDQWHKNITASASLNMISSNRALENEISPKVQLEIHKNGGHVGFVTGSLFKPVYYLEKRMLTYFDEFKSITE
ncbi:hydrolase [Marinomonas sp. C2222]|uniref:Hydrolase n=1 Tax=Marinomonas sargassi TaxID=2984494 RepID=A0ABT2YTU3_9GAMM|nr:hydrolase [Marinomonas sargassi]MCV2403034.1 hydrolase [Marinomonas sargassi]